MITINLLWFWYPSRHSLRTAVGFLHTSFVGDSFFPRNIGCRRNYHFPSNSVLNAHLIIHLLLQIRKPRQLSIHRYIYTISIHINFVMKKEYFWTILLNLAINKHSLPHTLWFAKCISNVRRAIITNLTFLYLQLLISFME